MAPDNVKRYEMVQVNDRKRRLVKKALTIALFILYVIFYLGAKCMLEIKDYVTENERCEKEKLKSDKVKSVDDKKETK